MTRCYLNSMAMVSALGSDLEDIKARLLNGQPQLEMSNEFNTSHAAVPLGKIQEALPELPLKDAKWQTRNNQIAWAVTSKLLPQIQSAIDKFGAERVAVIIGTSTSGIGDSEFYLGQRALTGELSEKYHYGLQEMGATAHFIASATGAKGPTFGVSTACSSGAKALASGRRLIRSGFCDAVIAGGVDSLCQLTVQGFSSLEAISTEQCNPFSRNRNGINIGEAGGLFLMTKEASEIELLGVGESSDAHHISAPDPTGAGAIRCMDLALKDAEIAPGDIDYLNLHGTATELNDQMESKAVDEVFGKAVQCSSTKPFTGHTLGAAGALEAAICWLSLRDGMLPLHFWDGEYDPDLPELAFSEGIKNTSIRYALSNSFAFGGNNISLILSKR